MVFCEIIMLAIVSNIFLNFYQFSYYTILPKNIYFYEEEKLNPSNRSSICVTHIFFTGRRNI